MGSTRGEASPLLGVIPPVGGSGIAECVHGGGTHQLGWKGCDSWRVSYCGHFGGADWGTGWGTGCHAFGRGDAYPGEPGLPVTGRPAGRGAGVTGVVLTGGIGGVRTHWSSHGPHSGMNPLTRQAGSPTRREPPPPPHTPSLATDARAATWSGYRQGASGRHRKPVGVAPHAPGYLTPLPWGTYTGGVAPRPARVRTPPRAPTHKSAGQRPVQPLPTPSGRGD